MIDKIFPRDIPVDHIRMKLTESMAVLHATLLGASLLLRASAAAVEPPVHHYPRAPQHLHATGVPGAVGSVRARAAI
jgi:hypothetical protein